MNDSFAELRSLLSRIQNRNVFAEIFWLFDNWDELETLELGLTYAKSHLATWSHELLSYPNPFEMLHSSNSPALALCQCLSLRDDQKSYKTLGKCQNLTYFSMVCAHLSRSGSELLQTLAKSRYVSQLRKLDLRYCELTTEALQAFVSSQSFSNLESLLLSGLSDDSVPILSELHTLDSLVRLHLRPCSLSKNAQEEILEAFPDVEVLFE